MQRSLRWLFTGLFAAAGLTAPMARAAGTCVRDLPHFSPATAAPAVKPSGYDLPHLGVSARWNHNDLMFATARDEYDVGRFVPGFDIRQWYGVDELDGTWLYLAGGDFSYVVKFAAGNDGRWRPTRTVLVTQPDMAGGGVLGWLLGDGDIVKRTGADGQLIVRYNDMRYSPAIRRLMFFKSGQELYDGHLRPLAGGAVRGLAYVGELMRLSVVLLRGPDGQLYGYDGTTLRAVLNGNVSADLDALPARTPLGPYVGRIVDVPEAGKSFYMLGDAVFEIQSGQGRLSLRRIGLPDQGDLFFTRIIALAGRLAVLTREHIYWLDDPRPLYSVALGYDTQIDTTGSDVYPRFEARYEGIVFATGGDHSDGGSSLRYHVFGSCTGVRR